MGAGVAREAFFGAGSKVKQEMLEPFGLGQDFSYKVFRCWVCVFPVLKGGRPLWFVGK